MTEENLIDIVFSRIHVDKTKLESNELMKIEVDSFNLSDFWNQFEKAVQALSNEVTKVGFMCGKKPFPKSNEITSMLQDLLQYYSMMRDLYLVVPEQVGAVVYNSLTKAVMSIITALLDIVRSLKDLTEKGAKERLLLTGTFWDACNAVESLPRNNLQATLKVIEGECSLAADAQDELNSTQSYTTGKESTPLKKFRVRGGRKVPWWKKYKAAVEMKLRYIRSLEANAQEELNSTKTSQSSIPSVLSCQSQVLQNPSASSSMPGISNHQATSWNRQTANTWSKTEQLSTKPHNHSYQGHPLQAVHREPSERPNRPIPNSFNSTSWAENKYRRMRVPYT